MLTYPLRPPELLTWGWVLKLLRVLAEQGVLNVAATHPTGSCRREERTQVAMILMKASISFPKEKGGDGSRNKIWVFISQSLKSPTGDSELAQLLGWGQVKAFFRHRGIWGFRPFCSSWGRQLFLGLRVRT